MKELSTFYRIFKIIIFIADIFAICIYSSILILTLISGESFLEAIILIIISALILTIIEVSLLKYYQNIVISIEFVNDYVIINTNKAKYILPDKCFIRVKEETSNGRTYIFYNDGIHEKKFVYIMKYLFKTYHLDIEEMKRHMPYTVFE